MGLEARCRATFGGKSSEGLACLEEKDLVFRGEGGFRFKVPLKDVRASEVLEGVLRLELPGGAASFALGPQAEKWALKIRYPRGLLDKLGVKPGARVCVVGLDEAWLLRELEVLGAEVSCGRLRKDSDLVLVGMSKPADLVRLNALREAIKPEGGVWVIWPKGRKAFREDDVRAAGRGAGLVDVKVVSVSDTLSGLKMVIPLAQRAQRPRR